MPTYIQLMYLGHLKMQLVNEAFQFASVDITNGSFDSVVLRLHGSSRSQFGVRNIPTIDEL